MALAKSKITAQGQISVPLDVRRKLGVGPGSVLEWAEEGDKLVVRKSAKFSSLDIHSALFGKRTPKAHTLKELKRASSKRFWTNMRAVETNVLVRLLTRDDPDQAGAADRFVERGGWISLLVLVETIWVLSKVFQFGPQTLASALEMLLDHEQLTIQDPDVVFEALEEFKLHPSVGFSDCLILSVARKAGNIPLGTFDRGLARLPDVQRL